MSREERSLLMGNRNNEVPLKRFWTALQKNCEQLQEAACRPLALWRSNSLGLYGTIQQVHILLFISDLKVGKEWEMSLKRCS